MNTDELCEILYKKALDREKDHYTKSWQAYNKALGLSGTVENITLEDEKGIKVTLYTTDIFKAITDQLLQVREEKIKARELSDFLKKFESFGQHMAAIEEYAQQMIK